MAMATTSFGGERLLTSALLLPLANDYDVRCDDYDCLPALRLYNSGEDAAVVVGNAAARCVRRARVFG